MLHMSRFTRFVLAIIILSSFAINPTVTLSNQVVFKNIQTGQENTIIFEVPVQAQSYSIENTSYEGKTYATVSYPGWMMSAEPGFPVLPYQTKMIGIPFEVDIQIQAVGGKSHTIQLSAPLIPAVSQEVKWNPQVLGEIPAASPSIGQFLMPEPSIYQSPYPYPNSLAKVINDGVIRQQRIASIAIYPFQYNTQENSLQVYESIRVQVSFEGNLATTGPEVTTDSPAYETLFETNLVNYQQAINWRAPKSPVVKSEEQPASAQMDALQAETHWNPPSPSWKIRVKDNGFYGLTYAELLDAGVPVSSLNPRNLQLYNLGEQVAIEVLGESDGVFNTTDKVIFYNQGQANKYNANNIFWLVAGDEPGLRMSPRDGAPGTSPDTYSYPAERHLETNKYYLTIPPGDDEFERFLWDFLYPPTKENWTHTFSMASPAPGPGQLTVSMLGYANNANSPNHHVRVYLNNTYLGETWWDGITYETFSLYIPNGILVAGSNTVKLSSPYDPDLGIDIIHIDWMKLEYPNSFTAENDQLAFSYTTPGTWNFQVNGFNNPDIKIYDISNPVAPAKIINPGFIQETHEYAAIFEDTVMDSRSYYALTGNSIRTVLEIVEDFPSSLQSFNNAADYIIITHRDFWTEAQSLSDFRTTNGLVSIVVDVQDIYDEFSYGLAGVTPIKEFLAYAYSNWQPPAPTYVLLLGDGHFDPKNYMDFGRTSFIPPYLAMADPGIGETVADNRFVAFSGSDNFPDMILGRLPVNTSSEAAILVNKIMNYEVNPLEGEWRSQVLAIADNADFAGDFAQITDSILDIQIPDSFLTEKIYLNLTHSTDNVRAAIQSSINTGKFFVHYMGHGSYAIWAEEQLLKTGDIPNLLNGEKSPIVLSMTCRDGYFIFPDPYVNNYEALGEVITRADGRGAVASWSPSGLGVATGHHHLSNGFFSSYFQNNASKLGEATIAGKMLLWSSGYNLDLLDTYHLFGDPAMILTRGMTAVDDNYSTPQETTLVLDPAEGVLSNDINPGGLPISAELVAGTSHGELNFNPDGSFTYQPETGWYGVDSFTYKILAGDAYSNTATVSIYVETSNRRPVASNDAYTVVEDNVLEIPAPGILANDGDADGDSLTAVILTDPNHGSLQLNPNGSFNYTPDANYSGSDSFTYRAFDGINYSDLAQVNISITPINDAPIVSGIPDQTIGEGETFVKIYLDNYVEDSDHLPAQMIWSYSGNAELIVNILDRVATITLPSVDWNGSETITFTATDPGGLSDQDSATFTVSAVNDSPVNSLPDPQTTLLNTALVFSTSNLVSVTDVDVAETEGGQLQVTLSVAHGSLTLSQVTGLTFSSGNGTEDASMIFTGLPAVINAALDGMRYLPTTGYSGSDTLSITTSDLGNTGTGGVLSDTDTLSITILDLIRIYVPLILK